MRRVGPGVNGYSQLLVSLFVRMSKDVLIIYLANDLGRFDMRFESFCVRHIDDNVKSLSVEDFLSLPSRRSPAAFSCSFGLGSN